MSCYDPYFPLGKTFLSVRLFHLIALGTLVSVVIKLLQSFSYHLNFSFLIINYNISLSFLKSFSFSFFRRKEKNRPISSNQPKEDKYNTVEYAVDEEQDNEGFSSVEPENGSTNPGNNTELSEPMIVVDPGVENKEPDDQ